MKETNNFIKKCEIFCWNRIFFYVYQSRKDIFLLLHGNCEGKTEKKLLTSCRARVDIAEGSFDEYSR